MLLPEVAEQDLWTSSGQHIMFLLVGYQYNFHRASNQQICLRSTTQIDLPATGPVFDQDAFPVSLTLCGASSEDTAGTFEKLQEICCRHATRSTIFSVALHGRSGNSIRFIYISRFA
jgi:hypothetical protein